MRYSCYPTLHVKKNLDHSDPVWDPTCHKVGEGSAESELFEAEGGSPAPKPKPKVRLARVRLKWKGFHCPTRVFFGVGPVSSFCWCSPFLQVVGFSFLGVWSTMAQQKDTKSNTPRRTQYHHRCFCWFLFGNLLLFDVFVSIFRAICIKPCMTNSSLSSFFKLTLDWFPNGVHVFSSEKVTQMGPLTRSWLEEPG